MKLAFVLGMGLASGVGYGLHSILDNPQLDGTTLTVQQLVGAINEDRKSITLLSNSFIELIKKYNEIAPPDKRLKEFKK